MKIALIGYNPREIGGIQSFSRNFHKNIHHVDFIFEYDQKSIFSVENCKPSCTHNFFNRCINKITGGKLIKKRMRDKILEGKYDIYILNTPRYLDIIPDLNKAILVQHTTIENWISSKYKFGNNEKLINLSRKTIKIVALSEGEAVEINRKLGVDNNRIKVINLPSTLPLFENDKIKGRDVVMFTRFENKIKRIDLAIEAMKLLPEFNLKVYGSGPDRNSIVALSRGLSNVKILPAVTKIQDILDKSSIYLLTSDIEGYPVTLIEAISRKLPLVVRDTFISAADIVQNNGVLVSKDSGASGIKDAILNCYENYNKYSCNCSYKYAKHNVNTVKSAWLSLINEVINER